MFRIRFQGVTITISGMMIPLVIIFYFSGYLGEYLKIYAYIAIHELMHGVAAVACGSTTESVMLTPGGMCLRLGRKVAEIKKKLFILMMGPAANVMLAGLFFMARRESEAQANLALAVFNLLPVEPLDGYEIFLTAFKGDRARETAKIVSKIVMVMMACLVGYGFIMGRGSIISAITFLFIMMHFSRSGMEGKVMNAKNLFNRRIKFQKKGFYDGKILSVLVSAKIGKIISKLGQDNFHFIFIVDDNFILRGIVTEQQIINAIVDNKGDLTFGDLLSK